MNDIKSVCVFCASSTKVAPTYYKAAQELGQLLANSHITLINGAGAIGLMKASSDAALMANGKVIGVIPQFMVDEGWQHTNLTQLIVTDDMHQRKQWMAEHGDGIIALPGGCGTLEELLEVITWKQLGIYLKPIVILNINGYFNPLIKMLEHAISENFMRKEHGSLWTVANTPAEAIHQLRTTKMITENIRKYAVI